MAQHIELEIPFPNAIDYIKYICNHIERIFAYQVLHMGAKMLGCTLAEKMENRKAEVYYTGLGLKSGV